MNARAVFYPKPEIIMIPLHKIKTLYEPKVAKTFTNRMRNNYYYLETFDFILPVEKNPRKDEYVLVGRYDMYSFITNETRLKEAPCIIEVYTGATSQYLKILSRLHNKGDANNTNKEYILSKPQIRNLPSVQIELRTGFTKREIRDYYYKPAVPKEHINQHTTVKTLNWISNLQIDQTVKLFLYRCAGLPEDNRNRLTEEKRKHLQRFFKHAQRFEQLSSTEKIQVLRSALNFNDSFIQYLQIRIDSFLK